MNNLFRSPVLPDCWMVIWGKANRSPHMIVQKEKHEMCACDVGRKLLVQGREVVNTD